jgi:S1-C subfamily serine protease
MSQCLANLVEESIPAVVTLSGVTNSLDEVRGSGFAVDGLGHIVTNHHVVEDVGKRVVAAVHGGLEVSAEVIGRDAVTDLAIVRLKSPISSSLKLRQNRPRVGELCVAIGSPLGEFSESVSLGVISGLDRSLAPYGDGTWPMEHMIQTDAAINHGNSGGPLLDMTGLVVGVNECGRTDGQNINFAVPADTTRSIASELIDYGEVKRAALGIVVVPNRVSIDGQSLRRLVVRETKDSDSRFRPGDVLLRVGATQISDKGDLFRSLSRDLIGTPTVVQIVRDGQPVALQVVPAEVSTSSS